MSARCRFSWILGLTAPLLAAGVALAQPVSPPDELSARVYGAYVAALNTCIHGRTEVEVSRGRRDAAEIAAATAGFCGPGYIRAIVQRRLTSREEAEATVEVIAWREANRFAPSPSPPRNR
jgi:hypothetical protein